MAKPIVSITGTNTLVRPGSPERATVRSDGKATVTDHIFPDRRPKAHGANLGKNAIARLYRQAHDDRSESTVVHIADPRSLAPSDPQLYLQEYDRTRGEIWATLVFVRNGKREIALSVMALDPQGQEAWNALRYALAAQPNRQCYLSDLNI